MPDDNVTAPRPRFQRLRDRLAGRPADTTLRRDIPEPLAPVLWHWIVLASQSDSDAPQRVALRLGLPPVPGGRGQFEIGRRDCKNNGSGTEEVVGSACPDRVTGSGL